MAKNTNRRPQAKKPTEVRRVQELRRSNAASSIPSGKKYSRKSKHREW